MSESVVAIIGRPNVGKSTLFNKLTGTRTSIVDDTPGVTRDRIFGECEWLQYRFALVDTGGLEPAADDEMLRHMRDQAQLAIDMADVIIFVTDVRSGVTANDREIANLLRRSGRPVVLCVNKCDTIGEPPADFYEFYALGLGDPVAVSSVHGHGSGDLLDAVTALLPEKGENDEAEYVKVAVIGKPNAGKSTLINTVLGEKRMIVSDVPGTTRDAVDAKFENEFGKFIFIDTAGIRRQAKVTDNIEKYSILRAEAAVARADVCVIMVDATEGFTEQDSKVAGRAHDAGKACIIAVNKWDAVEAKTGKTMDEQRKKYAQDFSFMSYAPIIFISAKTGQRLDRLFELIKYVNEQNAMRVTTGMLNDMLARATERVQPPTDKGRRLRIYYMTQPSTRPPTFVLFVNKADLCHFSYVRYIENQIRESFGLEGTPIRMIIREREHGGK